MDEKISNLIKIKDEFNKTMMENFLESYKNKLNEMTPEAREKKNQGGGSNKRGHGLRRRGKAKSKAASADSSDESTAMSAEMAAQMNAASKSRSRQQARQNLGLGSNGVETQQQLNSMATAISQLMVMFESGQNETHTQIQAVAQTLASIDQSTQDAEQQRDNLKEQADKHYKNIMNGINDIKSGIKDDAHCIEDTSKNGLLFGLVMGNLFSYYYQDSPSNNTGMSVYSPNTTDVSLYNNQPYNMKKAAVNTAVSGVVGGLMGYFYKCILLLLRILRKILTFILNTYISINLFIYYFAKLWGESWDMVFLSSFAKAFALIIQICVNMWLWILLFKMFGFDNIITTISTKIIKPIINTIYSYIKDIPSDIISSIGAFTKPIVDILDALVPDDACEGAPEVGEGRFMHCCIGYITSIIASMINSMCCAGGNRYLNPLHWCCNPSEETPQPPPPAPPAPPPSNSWFGYGGSYKESNDSYNYVPKSNMNDDDFVKYVTIILSSKLIIKNKKDIDNIKNNIIKFLDILVKLLGFLNFVANVLVKSIKMRETQLKLSKSSKATLSRKKRVTSMKMLPRKSKTGSKKIRMRPIRLKRLKRRTNKK
jgi:hypothetical protein